MLTFPALIDFIQKGSNNYLYLISVHLVIIIFPIGLDLTNYLMKVDCKLQNGEQSKQTLILWKLI